MKKYGVTCTIIYNGYVEIDAENEAEALDKARGELNNNNLGVLPNDVQVGEIDFTFGEATADYADDMGDSEEEGDYYSELEENYRTHNDTQIFKQYDNDKCEISNKEWRIIILNKKDGDYKTYDDEANGLYAISFSAVDQKKNPEFGDDLVDMLNDICISNGENPNWFLGDANEEYVFVD